MKKMVKILVAAVCCVAFACQGAESECPNWPDNGFVGSDGAIVPGDWNSNFAKGKAYAEEHHLPMVLLWANHDCHYCESLEVSIQDANFVSWRKTRRLVMVFSYGKCDEDKLAAFNFANMSAYPICRVYWVERDGTTHSKAFTARASAEGKTVAMNYQQFADKIDSVLEGFGYDFNTCDSYFGVSGTEGDRLEAQIGKTSYVDVPISRYVDDIARTDRLEIVRGAAVETTNIVWRAGELDQNLRVSVPTAGAAAGDRIGLTIRSFDGKLVQTNAITYVDLADSPDNPLWTTERDVETLGYGEWTADLDTATNKVAAAKGTTAWTLVYSHGSQWCPYCYVNGPSFINTATFRQWARDNNVVLVSADMPRNSDSNPDQDWCTIWHRKAEETNLYFDGKGKILRSGAGYLSRKMISEDEAAAMRAKLKVLNTSFLHLPEDYQTARSIIPGLTLINAAGRVVGRFETFDYNMNNYTDGSRASLYCKRLDEMIQAATTAPVSDRNSENLNDNCETTPLSLSLGVQESSADGTVSHADYRDVYRLTGAVAGMQTQFTVKGDRDDVIRLCFLSGDKNGRIGGMIKTVTGNLRAGVSIDTASIPGFSYASTNTYFVRVACRDIMPTTSSNYRPYRLRWGDNEDDPTFNGYAAFASGSTLTSYSLSAVRLFVPVETRSTYAAKADESLTFSVLGGETYRFVGLNPPASSFTALGDDLYLATATNCVKMVAAAPAHEVVYQLWRPGTIALNDGDQRLLERDGAGTVTVVRGEGSSDACNVTVRVRPDSEWNVEGRYAFAETNLVWESGETGEKTVPFKLIENGRYDGEGSFVVELVAKTPCAATVSSVGETITILDTTSPIFEKSDYSLTIYSGFACETAFGVRNIGAKGSVRLTATEDSDKLPAGVKLAYDKATGAVMLTGTPKAKAVGGTYETEYTITQNKDTGYPTTISLTVKDPSDFNPYIGVAWSSLELPLCVVEDGTNYIDGLLTVSITAKNKIKAKYADADVSSLAFSGMWSELDEETGVVSTTMWKNGRELSLSLSRDGVLTAQLDGEIAGEVALDADGDFGAWTGYYTVSLPGRGASPCGSGYLTLPLTTTAAVSKGRVKFTGLFPDGQSFSGSASLRRSGDKLLLPVFKRASKYSVGVMLELAPNGASRWNDPENVQAREVIRLAEGYGAYFRRGAGGAEELTLHDAAGSWYPTALRPGDIVETFYGIPDQLFEMSVTDGDGRVVVGAVSAVGKTLAFEEKPSGATLSFTAKKGIFKGKAKVTFADGSVMNGRYAGVLVPGWYKNCECGDAGIEFPFGSGTFYGNRKTGGTSRSVSQPLVIDLPKTDD